MQSLRCTQEHKWKNLSQTINNHFIEKRNKSEPKGSDLFICEGMYAEKEKIAKARQYKHMTFYEAAEMAKRANVKEMWLTHFSPSLVRGEDYMPAVRKIFGNSYLGKDGKTVELKFQED